MRANAPVFFKSVLFFGQMRPFTAKIVRFSQNWRFCATYLRELYFLCGIARSSVFTPCYKKKQFIFIFSMLFCRFSELPATVWLTRFILFGWECFPGWHHCAFGWKNKGTHPLALMVAMLRSKKMRFNQEKTCSNSIEWWQEILWYLHCVKWKQKGLE